MGISDWFGEKKPEKPQVPYSTLIGPLFKAAQAKLKKSGPAAEYEVIAIAATEDFDAFYAAYAGPGWEYEFVYAERGEVGVFRDREWAEAVARVWLINQLNARLRQEKQTA